MSDKSLQGIYEIGIKYSSSFNVDLTDKKQTVKVSHADCEPSTLTAVTAGTALTASLTSATTLENKDLTPAFSVTDTSCKFQYTLAWKYTTNSYNALIRTGTTLTIANDGKATIALIASDNMVDGIHVFTIGAKSIHDADLTGTNTLTVTKSTDACEIQALITGSESAKGPFKHRILAAEANFDWNGAYSPVTSTCTFKYEVTVPSSIGDHVALSPDVTAPFLTMPVLANVDSAPIGRHEFKVKYLTIGGVDTGKVATFEVRINHAGCEKSNSGGFEYTVGSDNGVAISKTLGDAAFDVAFSFTQTSTTQANC